MRISAEKVQKWALSWLVPFAGALLIALFLQANVCRLTPVDGSSMKETLRDGERMYVNVIGYRNGGAARGDVVTCRYPGRGSTEFVKRVRGVPGDTVARVAGVTYINGEAVDPDTKYRFADYTYTLGEGEYFMVGDNLYDSHDSRWWQDERIPASQTVGPIAREDVIGVVECVIWPLNAIRGI